MVNLILIHDAAVSRTNNLLSIVKVCHLNSNSNQGFAYLVRHFLITCTKKRLDFIRDIMTMGHQIFMNNLLGIQFILIISI